MADEFVSEPIKPLADGFDTTAMARGEPGLPLRFVWRGEEHAVAEVLETWRELGAPREGGEPSYLRKHWFRIRTDSGFEMKLYFERQPRSGGRGLGRWWVYSMKRPQTPP